MTMELRNPSIEELSRDPPPPPGRKTLTPVCNFHGALDEVPAGSIQKSSSDPLVVLQRRFVGQSVV